MAWRMVSCFFVRVTTRETWKPRLASRRYTLYLLPNARSALSAVNGV